MNGDSPVRLLVHGASGRMGRSILRLAQADSRFRVAAAIVGRDPDALADAGVPVLHSANFRSAPEFDVAIDFSLPQGFDGILSLCLERGAALVSGTTGLAESQLDALDAGSSRIAIVWAANFSLGVMVASELARRAAAALAAWDCDIVEAHHSGKKDMPSGGRPPSYSSLRAGDIVGEHTVQFSGIGERLEIIHRATDRDIFARGALAAAARLISMPVGRYPLASLLMDES